MQNQAVGKISKIFLYLAPYSRVDFTIGVGKKFMSKKKSLEIGLIYAKKRYIGA